MADPREKHPLRLAVLVTCFNRVHLTVPNLIRLAEALTLAPDLSFHFYVVDDGSRDGTGEKVTAALPDVAEVTVGSGALFWNGGMRLAHEKAREAGPHDAYFLFNDDVVVIPSALANFVNGWRARNRDRSEILVGAMVDESGSVCYTGYDRSSPARPLALTPVFPGKEPTPCATFNGNAVLVPAALLDQVGFDPAYIHQWGDIDLGLVAGAKGVPSFVWPEPVGVCPDDSSTRPKPRGFWNRLRLGLTGRESFAQRAHFILKHGPRPLAYGQVAVSLVRRIGQLVTNA